MLTFYLIGKQTQRCGKGIILTCFEYELEFGAEDHHWKKASHSGTPNKVEK